MALLAKLVLRQGQAMVLTPQLLQAIKLLQMPNQELTQFIENELASNPLLERAEEREDANAEPVEPPGFAEALRRLATDTIFRRDLQARGRAQAAARLEIGAATARLDAARERLLS